MNNKGYTIELDCDPFSPRPDVVLTSVLHDLPIKPEHLGETISRSFGNWTWTVPMDIEEQYVHIRPIVAERIKDAYHAGRIRYGSW